MLSGKEVRKFKTLRGRLAVLCPETDGLQDKHRIRYELEGRTLLSQQEEILDIEAEIILPGITKGEHATTQRISRLISLIYKVTGFSQEEVYRILCNKRFKNRKT